ncbi:hypothetical protein ABT301_29540 [Streptomyces sp. NPDC000987]|uniref:hypothetical protein n=1 Tax=Streptomyces sp. NPDC000987 TaxID=3154374 RepID=UPI00331BB942
MSGCCGQGPVIISGNAAATPRVDVEAVLLCDVQADGTVAATVLVEPIYDTGSGARVGTRIVDPATGADYTPVGTLSPCGGTSPEGCARQVSVRTRCDDTDGDGTGDATYVEVWVLDPCDGGAPSLLGMYESGDLAKPYTPAAPVDCPEPHADTPVVLGTVCYDDGTGTVRTAAVLKCAGCADTAVTYLDAETGAQLTTPAVVPCPATGRSTQLLCDVQADGSSTPFLRTYTGDGAAVTTVDTLLDGVTAYAPTGTVGVCPPVSDCPERATPTATVGLCLPDGTPIAVTVVRDCAGVVTSEGWINLRTGAYSAGPPPTGAVACGSSQSVQVSGTFCDVDQTTGDVLGLVLIEYSYAADGTIASVRLVDATTGTTYAPQGEVTTCPAGTEQPEQDLVQLCDVQADGTVTPFVRDYRRDETGAVTGHSDYTLDGTAYQPTGTVGVCEPPAAEPVDVETFPLCLIDDATGDVVQDVRAEAVYDDTGTRTALRFVDPVTGATVTPAAGQHLAVCPSPDPCAKTIIERCGCDDTTGDGVGDVTYTELWAVDPCNGAAPELLGTYEGGDLAKPYTPTSPVDCTASDALDAEPVQLCDVQADGSSLPFLRHLRYDETGTPVSVLDTTLDGVTAYTVTGTAGTCAEPPSPDPCTKTVVERCGCDDTTGDGVGDVTYTELWAVDPCNGAAPELLGTYESGDLAKPYTPTNPVDCTAGEDADGEPLLLCDSGTPFLRHIRYAGGVPVSVLDTALDGVTAYTVTGTVGTCAAPPPTDTVVNTGLNRLTAAGTFDVKGAAPGLQSATVTVLAGTAQVTTSSGTVTIPAGLSLTWSVSDDDDSVLSVLSVTAPAGADVVTNYTSKTSAAG